MSSAATHRPIILCFVGYYLPGFRAGGPQRTISNFVDRLGDEFDIRIVTSDHDIGCVTPYPNVRIDSWNQVGEAKVFYSSAQSLSLMGVARLLRETPHDVLYLNSFWAPKFTGLPLLVRRLGLAPKTPCVIAPRGELSPGALALKANKKRLYLAATRALGLYAGLLWQASSEHERADILRTLPWLHSGAIHVAMNLAVASDSDALLQPLRLRSREEPLRVCFLSRISPMKNLDFALRVLANVHSSIVFTIYGPKQNAAYWEACQALISVLPPNIRVIDGGEVHPSNVKARLSEQDLFFLPTRGENYGHVIHEALSAGLPVLISDQTPWQDLEEGKVGYGLALKSENVFAEKIDVISSWSGEDFLKLRRRAQAYAALKSSDVKVTEANRTLFFRASS